MINPRFTLLIAVSLLSACAVAPKTDATTTAAASELRISYSDGRPDTVGVDKVNVVLRRVGVRVGLAPLPVEARPILETSHARALKPAETERLLSLFSLHRGDLLEEIKRAGREPEAHRGGYLSTSEVDVPPYPKVYDIRSLTPEIRHYLQEKFGKLHVNSADNGVGIDEVMTIVSGGPWVWFFVLPNDVVAKLTLSYVGLAGPAWRISYPGLVPHGGFLDPEYGLVVAHAHGPKRFVMRYEEPSVPSAHLLGDNPWIDFSGEVPRLLERVKTKSGK